MASPNHPKITPQQQEEEQVPPHPQTPKDSSPGERKLLGLLDNSRAVAATERSQCQIPVPDPSARDRSHFQAGISDPGTDPSGPEPPLPFPHFMLPLGNWG